MTEAQSMDQELAELIAAFIAQGVYTDTLGRQQDINRLRSPEGAAGQCNTVAFQFARFAKDMSPGLNVTIPDDCTPESCGYHDRTISGFCRHSVVEVVTPTGVFMVDFTAAQYGYSEFPLVRALERAAS